MREIVKYSVMLFVSALNGVLWAINVVPSIPKLEIIYLNLTATEAKVMFKLYEKLGFNMILLKESLDK